MSLRRFTVGSIAVALLLQSALLLAAMTPKQQVKQSVDEILAVVKDTTLDNASRRAKIRMLVNERFDFREMSRRVLATNWKKATEDERAKFAVLLSQILENTYIGAIEQYDDEAINYKREKVFEGRRGRSAAVDTIIVQGAKGIPVRYKLREKDGEWFVYDVVIEGVSLVNNYKGSYQGIVKSSGMSGLLSLMAQRIQEQEAAMQGQGR